ncbi:hypothetical protein BH10PSE2_BH10PSE2_21520 [soil metagenome]
MRLFLSALALGVLISGCSPMAGPSDPAVPGQSAEASACVARGGEIRRVGRMQTPQCIIRYADAGKTCTDGDQCAGDCRIEGNSGVAPGTSVTGKCQADGDRFGCNTTVEDGKAAQTLCID